MKSQYPVLVFRRSSISEDEYRAKHAELCRRFEETENRLIALNKQRQQMKNDAIAIGGMLFELSELASLPISFNDKLWNTAIERVIVYADEQAVFHFKDGKKITQTL